MARAIAFVMLLATQLRAGDSDFRAGLWEGTIERGRGVERIVLLLTISVQAMDGPNTITSAFARVESNSGICGANKAGIEPNRVSFECMTISKRGEAESAGYFEGYFSPRSNLLTGTWRGEPIQLTRPKQTDLLIPVGDWVAEGAGQTCVVRFFDGNRSRLMSGGSDTTIDIYSAERAVFGKQISSHTYPDYQLNFGWVDIDKNMFLGTLSANKSEITGKWQGSDFLCSAPDHKITFRRTQSSL